MGFLNIVVGVPIRLLLFVPGWIWGHISAGFLMGFHSSRSYDNRMQTDDDAGN